jgi:hypothetical protein
MVLQDKRTQWVCSHTVVRANLDEEEVLLGSQLAMNGKIENRQTLASTRKEHSLVSQVRTNQLEAR